MRNLNALDADSSEAANGTGAGRYWDAIGTAPTYAMMLDLLIGWLPLLRVSRHKGAPAAFINMVNIGAIFQNASGAIVDAMTVIDFAG